MTLYRNRQRFVGGLRRFGIFALIAMLFIGLVPAASAAGPYTVVTPANPDGWQPLNVRTDATVGITNAQPRGDMPNNLGSLQFTTNTVTNGQDKADYVKYWGVVAGRTLGSLSALSYEFYRASSSTTAQHFVPAFRLAYQTPDNHTGYLIWENVYNGGSTSTPVPTDQWLAKDIFAGNFWMREFSPGATIQNYGVTLAEWQANNDDGSGTISGMPGDAAPHVLGPDTSIIGIEIGVGSGWGNAFTGYVDNVAASFGSDSVTANFEPNPLVTQCTTTCYVNGTTGSDTNGGASAGDAKQTIQAALNQVSPNGTVIIAAGTYNESTTINKDGLTVQGAGQGQTIIQGDGVTCNTAGVALSGARSNITLEDFSVTGFLDGIQMFTGPLTNIVVEDVAAVSNCRHGVWSQAFGINGLRFTRVTASSNNLAPNANQSGRGIWIINGVKQNITIEDSVFDNNRLVGADVSDGNVTGLTISGNEVSGNGDSGISVLGAQGPNANLITGNTVTNNGRFGIEIKNSTGSGADSGAGSLVVSSNIVSRNIAASDLRDYAGIVVMRRAPIVGNNADQPAGAVVANNEVRGYHRAPSGSTGDGFGIVVEGLNNVVKNNILTDNDVGIQVQGGNTANVQSTDFFDRGDAAQGGALVNRNSIAGNGIGLRTAGTISPTPLNAENNWWGSNTGPTNAGNPGGSGDSVVGANVDFDPWLCSGTDDQPGTTGFQTSSASSPCAPPPPQCTLDCYVDDDTGNDANGGTSFADAKQHIQAAVDQVSPNGTVHVKDGVYNEAITIGKPLTLEGIQHGVLAKGRPGPEAIIRLTTNQTPITINASNVTVDGFTFDMSQEHTPWAITALNQPSYSNLKLQYNLFTGNPGTGDPNQDAGGAYLRNTVDLLIEGNSFDQLGDHAIFLAGTSTNAIYRNNDSYRNFNSNISTQDTGAGHSNILIENNRAVEDDMILFNMHNATVRNNTITGGAFSTSRVWLGGGNSNVLITGNSFASLKSTAVQVFDAGFGYGPNSNITVTGNIINTTVANQNDNYSLIDFRDVNGSNLIDSNKVTLSGSYAAGGTATHAVGVRGSGTGTVTITNNEFDGGNVPSSGTPPSSAVLIRSNSANGALTASAVIKVANNYLKNFSNGLTVYDFVANSYGGLPAGVSLTVNFNSITGNSANGVITGASDPLLNAENNWWGANTGPTAAGNPSGTGDKATGNVDYDPWLCSGQDTSAATGFQPNPQTSPCTPPAGTLTVTKYNDLNRNHMQDSGELGLSGWKITVKLGAATITSGTTDGNGNVTFTGLAAGGYTVCETLQSGWQNTDPSNGSGCKPATVTAGNTTNVVLGNAQQSLTVIKYNDLNRNGMQDAGEPTLSGWAIKVKRGSNVVASGTTGSNGSVTFTGLAAGSYTVCETLQSGWQNTDPSNGSGCKTVTVTATGATTVLLGNAQQRGSVTVTKYNDLNHNGAKDKNEPTLSGWVITVKQGTTVVASGTTGSNGSATFNNLPLGNYTVCETQQSGWQNTDPSNGSGCKPVTITVNCSLNVLFGNTSTVAATGTLKVTKYNDVNRNGKRDSGEAGLSGWTITASQGATTSGSGVTNANGEVTFTLAPGSYKVCETKQTNWQNTDPSDGSGCKTVTVAKNSTATLVLGNAPAPSNPAPAQPGKIYAINDGGVADSQLFTVNLSTNAVVALGPLYKGYDLEGLDIHPTTGTIYVTSGGDNAYGQRAWLYKVDGVTGALTSIGSTGQTEVESLAFAPNGELWGWAIGKGLIKINLTTGASTLVFKDSKDVEGLAFSNDGSKVYAASGKKLYVYTLSTGKITELAANLPGMTEALETRPDGKLLLGVDGSKVIYVYDPVSKQVITSQSINVAPYSDVEGIGYSGS